MISLPANVTTATVPSRKEARKELTAFLRGRRARIGAPGSEPWYPHVAARSAPPGRAVPGRGPQRPPADATTAAKLPGLQTLSTLSPWP